MPIVKYHQSLERVIPVEVTERQLAALKAAIDKPHQYQLTEEEREARAIAQQCVTDMALMKREKYPLEFVMATVLDEDGNELYEIG